jgi:PDZ domain
VRALVREPATTDGRIRAGDKILAVNDIQISDMTHEQAVIFLRQAPETVKLRLYRMDESTTSEYNCYENNSTLKRSKLRPEAISLISVLATKKNTQSSSDGNSENSSFQSSTMSSPRRLRKNKITNASDTDNLCNSSSSNISSVMNIPYVVTEGTNSKGDGSDGTHTPFSDSSADTLTILSQRGRYYDPHELPADDEEITNDGFYDSDELENLEYDGECETRLKRPEYLNLQGGTADSGSTPIVLRKPMHNFSIAANAYELNILDNVLDEPTSYRMHLDMSETNEEMQAIDEHNYTSLPCETLLLACKTEIDLKNSSDGDIDNCLYVKKFAKNQPLYQSAQVQINYKKQQDEGTGEKNLLKWKGVTMPLTSESPPIGDDDKCSIFSSETPMASLRISIRNAQKDINLEEMCIDSNKNKVMNTKEIN